MLHILKESLIKVKNVKSVFRPRSFTNSWGGEQKHLQFLCVRVYVACGSGSAWSSSGWLWKIMCRVVCGQFFAKYQLIA